jgi:OmpA-OmpF porin, OOP family
VILILGASAVQAADNGFYLGAGAGLSMASTDTAGSIAITEFFGCTATSTSTDDSDMAVRIFAGYSFSKHIGVELNYADLGESSVTVQDDVNSLTDVYKFAVSGFGISAIGSLPITDKFSVFGKLGIFSWASDITANVDFGGGVIVSTKFSESGTAPMI